jgi:AcrR family transcriptional regulator
MPRVTQKHRNERREQILSAARRCFLRSGFHGTSMQDLFAEAQLSSGAVYGYFASKDDVIVAIAEENMREIVAMIETVAAEQPDRSVGAILADIFDLVRIKHTKDGLGGLALLVWAEALSNQEVRDKLTTLLTKLRADLSKVIRDRQRRGAITSDAKADAIAGLLISTVPGYIIQLALVGPAAAKNIPSAALALWP